ncbi:hypothetical protein ACF07D_07570 [Leucobacter sp. NPDC015123]|uniref:hypothetical protein n=1 Tax=Leucobacter sp. NPDC015123 TaxID=3364129 RepID=UPI0036F49119
MTILGVDFSLTSTGVCSIQDGEAECITVKSKKEAVWHEFPKRVNGIAYEIDFWANPGVEPERAQVVLETPAFAATSSSLDRMFGGWWMFVDALAGCGFEPPLLVTPAQVKKYATGKGNAAKDAVLASVFKRYPDVDVSGNDQADALVLAAIGAAVMGEPFNGPLTVAQQEVVEAVRTRAAF